MYKHFEIRGKTIRFSRGGHHKVALTSSISAIEFSYCEHAIQKTTKVRIDVDEDNELVRWASDKHKIEKTLEYEYRGNAEQENSWTVPREVFYITNVDEGQDVYWKYKIVTYTDNYELWNIINNSNEIVTSVSGSYIVNFNSDTGNTIGTKEIVFHMKNSSEELIKEAHGTIIKELYHDIDTFFGVSNESVNDGCYIKENTEVIVAEPVSTNINSFISRSSEGTSISC